MPSEPLARRLARPYLAPLAGLDRRVVAVGGASFLFIAARMGLLTFLGIFFTTQRGLALPLVGLAFLLENVVRALVGPLAGALSDRLGRRRVIVASAALSALVMPGFLLVRDAPTLLLWSAAAGLVQGGYFPPSVALLVDLAPEGRRQSVLAFHYMALSLGYSLGVAPGGLLAQRSYGLLAAASLAGFAAVAVVAAVALRGPLPREHAQQQGSLLRDSLRAPRDPAFATLAVLGFVFPLGLGLLSIALPVYASERGLGQGLIGLGLGASGLLMALLALPVNARVEASGPLRWLPLAAVLAGATYVLFASSAALPALGAGLLLFTLAEVLFSSALPAAVAQLAPPGARGAYQGAWLMVTALGVGSALFLGGLGRDALGWPATWAAFAAATFASGALLALARPRLRGIARARAAGREQAASPRPGADPAAEAPP